MVTMSAKAQLMKAAQIIQDKGIVPVYLGDVLQATLLLDLLSVPRFQDGN